MSLRSLTLFVAGMAALLGVAGGLASSGAEPATRIAPAPPPIRAQVDWQSWRAAIAPAAPAPLQASSAPAAEQIDVVDAHWMALTMWGEARGEDEAGMRAVGHVIDNRRRAGRPSGRFATDTVSEAWQFSCWNAGDPNRRAIAAIGELPQGSRPHRQWRLARALAAEILAGRSPDPTGGALFYHAQEVAPRWAAGQDPVVRIGRHIFYRSAA